MSSSVPGQVLGLRVVARLVGIPVHPVELAVGARVLVGAAHHHHVGVAHRPQLARRLLLDSVLGLEAARQTSMTMKAAERKGGAQLDLTRKCI